MEEVVECPRCASMAHDIGHSSTSLVMYHQFTDTLGRGHIHNPNETRQHRICKDCGIHFTVWFYYACWCGWVGGTTKILWDDTDG